MATLKFTTMVGRHGAWMALVLGVLFLSAGAGRAQEEASPARALQTLRQAMDLHKANDFEKAAQYFSSLEPVKQILPEAGQRDFIYFSGLNATALRSRQEGAAQIQQASAALKENRAVDAGNLLKSLNGNQYLTPADKQQVVDLNAKLQMQAATAQAPGKGDAKSLLAAGRLALQQNDLATAEVMATQADKASSLMPAWLQPWNDSPAKLRRDIQTAKAKLVPPTPAGEMPKVPDVAAVEPNKSTSKFMSFWPFGGSSTPAKNEKPASERRVDEMMARQIVKDGFIFLEANDLEKAQFIAMKAKEMNVTFNPGERTPDELLHEIQRRKGIAVAKPADPVAAKPAAEPMPTSTDPRVLLKHGRTLLEKKKYEEADKVCVQVNALNARWGLFEDNPDKLRKDIQKLRQSADRDLSVKLMVEARQAFAQSKLEEAEKKAYKAQQLHGPYGVFDFGDRPNKLLEEINRAKLARGPVNPIDEKVVKNDPPKGIPIEGATLQSANKNRAIVMVREAREYERQGMLLEAQQKALEARAMKVTFLPDEDSPDSVLWGLAAKCDRQIGGHLQAALQVAGNEADAQRFVKANEQLLAARRLAQMFQLDSGRIDQTQHALHQVATGAKSIHQVGVNPQGQDALLRPAPPNGLVTGDPKKDQLRKLAWDQFQQAQVELYYGKTGQAKAMALALYKEEYGLQKEVAALIRSIEAEEYNQQILEAKRTFDAGHTAFRNNDHKRALAIFQQIDTAKLPEQYQAHLRNIMSTREMQPHNLVLVSAPVKIGATNIKEVKPVPTPGAENLIDDVMAKEMVLVQATRQRGQEALRAANELYKNKQQEEAIKTLKNYLAQVDSYQFERQKANDLKRVPEKRIQDYQTDMADAKLRTAANLTKYTTFHDEPARQAAIRKNQLEIAERMKVVTEMMRQNKLKEAEVEVRKIREIDPENLAVIAALHIISNRRAQEKHDADTHANEKLVMTQLDGRLGENLTMEKPLKFGPNAGKYKGGDAGGISHPLSNPVEREIQYRLQKPISLHFKNVPLEQAITSLSGLSGVQVVPDYRAIQDAKINLDAPLSISVDNISMKSALKLMFDQLRLTYIIQNEVLMITTEDKTDGRLIRVTYPVADLIVVVPDHPLPDVLNMQKAIERAMSPTGVSTNYLTPPPYAFGAGEPVSSHGGGSGGLGGAFGARNGAPGQGGSQNHGQKDRSKEAMAEVLKELLQNTVRKNTWESMGGNGNIQYFPMGMAMVINQTQEVQEEVALLLQTLRRLQDLQVSVELRAVLVSETFFERIGVDFDMNIRTPTSRKEADLVAGNFVPAPFINRSGANLGRIISGLTSAGTLTPDLGIPIRNSTMNFTTPTFGGYQPEAGLSLGLAFLSDIQVFMFLEAVQGDRRAHIMQAPKLTVFNGQQATIDGTMGRFAVTGLQPAALGNNQLIMTPQFTFFPFGLGMQVQPVVSPDRRFIRLNVTPFVSQQLSDPAGAVVIAAPGQVPASFDPGVPFGGAPLQPFFANNPLNVTIAPVGVSLTVVNTTVNVPDGGTVLLGGFKFLAEERTEYGPPVLSKIPYLSRLFRNVGWSRDGSTLIYLVTARVIMVEEEERLFTGEIPPIPGR